MLSLFLASHGYELFIVGIYIALAMVNAMNQPWDGFYNWFYRVTHMLANSRGVQSFESKHGVDLSAGPKAAGAPPSQT